MKHIFLYISLFWIFLIRTVIILGTIFGRLNFIKKSKGKCPSKKELNHPLKIASGFPRPIFFRWRAQSWNGRSPSLLLYLFNSNRHFQRPAANGRANYFHRDLPPCSSFLESFPLGNSWFDALLLSLKDWCCFLRNALRLYRLRQPFQRFSFEGFLNPNQLV